MFISLSLDPPHKRPTRDGSSLNRKPFGFYNRKKTLVYMFLLFVQIPDAGDAQREAVSCGGSFQ